RGPTITKRNWRSRDGRPWVGLRFERSCALPGTLGRTLAAGMSDLNAELGAAHAPRLCNHARQSGFVVVGIQAHTSMGDAAVPLNMGCFHDHKGSSGMRQH